MWPRPARTGANTRIMRNYGKFLPLAKPGLQATWDYQIKRWLNPYKHCPILLWTSAGKAAAEVMLPSNSITDYPGSCQVLQGKKAPQSQTTAFYWLPDSQTFISRTIWTAAYTAQHKEDVYPWTAVLPLLMSSHFIFLEKYSGLKEDEANLPASTHQTILHVKQ